MMSRYRAQAPRVKDSLSSAVRSNCPAFIVSRREKWRALAADCESSMRG